VNASPEVRNQWSITLPIITRILNTTFHESLNSTPSFMVYGRYFTSARAIFPGQSKNSPTLPSKTTRDHYQKLIKLQAELLQASERFQATWTDKYVQTTQPVQHSDIFLPGSLVLVTYPTRPPSKLHPRLRGPFRVMERFSDDTYSCINLVNGQALSFHISQMRPYSLDISPSALSPVEVAAKDYEEFMVEAIIDHRVIPRGKITNRTHLEFLVAWLGYDESANTWEPYSIVKDLVALSDYVETVPALSYLV
jgi:Chromo (CHRromatin Organisation MOdifier) domain